MLTVLAPTVRHCCNWGDVANDIERKVARTMSNYHMRVSVPTIPHVLSSSAALPPIPLAQAVERISTFLRPGNVAVLTGAGVSVDSGVKAYRGKDGRYMNPNYKYEPSPHYVLQNSHQIRYIDRPIFV